MKLQRNPLNDSERRGTWYFTIEGKNAEAIETAENNLRAMECSFTLGGESVTWDKFCDGCPCFEDGFGSGFWIRIEDVEEFKAAWKKAKAKK